MEFVGPATKLSGGDITAVAAALQCTSAAVHAVCDVESAGGGFLPDGRPKILFESHSFHTLTHGRFGVSNISTPSWVRNYGPGGAHQYDRLAEAMKLDRAAALQSASWGMFQIMGSNHAACGFSDIEAMVAAMVESERRQLDAFSAFCRSERIDRFLESSPPAFALFAARYNGPGYAQNAYDVKLAGAFRKWQARPDAAANPAPRTVPELHYATLQAGSQSPLVAKVQTLLGIDPADGDFDTEATLPAVKEFQKAHGLVDDGVIGPLTAKALGIDLT